MPLRFKTEKDYQSWHQQHRPQPPPQPPPCDNRDYSARHPFTFAVLAIVTLFALYAIVVLWFTF